MDTNKDKKPSDDESNPLACGCGCDGHDECDCGDEPFEMLKLTIGDDEEVNCIILGIFDVEEKEYIALLPEGEDEVLLYRYTEDPADEDNVTLDSIESDDEFEKVSAAFNEYFEQEFDQDDEEDEDYEYETEEDKE